MAGEALIRSLPLGGQWSVLGTDEGRGVAVESLVVEADDWGPSAMSGIIKRDPVTPFGDLQAATPVEVEFDGQLLWAGRIKETPTAQTERQIAISCQGWQYHLDDDAYRKMYVHSSLSDWQDIRSSAACDLTKATTSVSISNGQSGVTLTWPKTDVRAANTHGGIFLDAGPDNLITRVDTGWTHSNNSATTQLVIAAANTIAALSTWTGTYVTTITVLNVNPTATANYTITGSRYVYISLADASAAIQTNGATDVWAKLTSLQVFTSTAYESGGASALVASDILKDALLHAPLLSRDTSAIVTTTFTIPDFAATNFQSPRSYIDAANAFHAYQARVRADNVLEYRARPATPLLMNFSGKFNDQSAGSLDQIYNHVLGSATGPDGVGIISDQVSAASIWLPASIQPTNPSADTALTGWSAVLGGTLTRDTVVFDTSPGSFKCALALTGGNYQGGFSTTAWSGGTFVPGLTYQLTFRSQTAGGAFLSATVTDANGAGIGSVSLLTAATFSTATITFSPQTSGSPTLSFFAGALGAGASFWVDTIALNANATTIPDRRGYRRTNVLATNMSLTQAALDQICQTFVSSHTRTPFKGTLTVTDARDVRFMVGGAFVPAWQLLRYVGELIHFPNLTDPDTGAKGRDGRIAAVSYTHDTRTASVSIDSQRSNFDALLARLQVVTGRVA